MEEKAGRGKHPNSLKNLRQWKKGERCNGAEKGNGVPKGYKRFGTLLQEIFDEEPNQDLKKNLMRILIQEAGKNRNMKAMEMIMDRMEGKPKETIDLNPAPDAISLADIENPDLKRELLEEELKKLNEEQACKK